MLTQQIRQEFLQYFKNQQHSIITSSAVVPHEDPTLLFTNAGMNQFKDIFLGKSTRDYKRATTSQKCIRAGGKHNDLENVGHTRRHLTFFEMLGNFSFGDYFKKDAIKFAWEVSTKIFGFDPNRIWPTVFRDDDEAFELWTHYVPAERITRFGEKDNFWAMGDTGPCGPCSELLYDRGTAYGKGQNPLEDPSGERFLEYWNLVFMQYNRTSDGVMNLLPKPSIDTGAGLERVISLKMDVDNVFETDILRSLIDQVEKVSGIPYQPSNEVKAPAFRVIADHLRSLSFAIADGAQPSNIDRGYVLRKILRRAVRYGKMLGMEEPFLAKILPRLVETMGCDYPEISKAQDRIGEILTLEEESFIRTLKKGGNMLNQIIEHTQRHGKTVSGDDAFKLKDTYGFPIEEILLIAKDAGLGVDFERYQALEQESKTRSRSTQKTAQQTVLENQFAHFVENHGTTEFLGYHLFNTESQVLGLFVEGMPVSKLEEKQEGLVVLNQTPFYAEMGGQVGDVGILTNGSSQFKVIDCQSPFKGLTVHIGKLEKGEIKVGDQLKASIDLERRQNIANHHTATHLLHWALHKVLGEHIKQAGSVVEPNRLRFDFSHHKPLTPEEIRHIETLVNRKIRENTPIHGYEIPYEEAQKRADIKQFFGEKYGHLVRVVDIDYSKELCGGTHTTTVGTIGLFKISKESSIAAGVRRIEAVTGEFAEQLMHEGEDLLNQTVTLLKTQTPKLNERIEKLLEENKEMAHELKMMKKMQIEKMAQSLINQIEILGKTPSIITELQLNPEELRICADAVMAKFPSGVLVLASKQEDKCHLLIRVTDDLPSTGIKANEIIKEIAPIIEGTGGGKPNQAQAGGKAVHKVQEALNRVRTLLKNQSD